MFELLAIGFYIAKHNSVSMIFCLEIIYDLLFVVVSDSGGWDSTGVTVVNVTDNTITCTSVHLTSFAVLVDVAGAHMVCRPCVHV